MRREATGRGDLKDPESRLSDLGCQDWEARRQPLPRIRVIFGAGIGQDHDDAHGRG